MHCFLSIPVDSYSLSATYITNYQLDWESEQTQQHLYIGTTERASAVRWTSEYHNAILGQYSQKQIIWNLRFPYFSFSRDFSVPQFSINEYYYYYAMCYSYGTDKNSVQHDIAVTELNSHARLSYFRKFLYGINNTYRVAQKKVSCCTVITAYFFWATLYAAQLLKYFFPKFSPATGNCWLCE